jgi:hypothetical protein
LVDAAAVLGRDVDAGLLADVTNAEGSKVLEATLELMDRQSHGGSRQGTPPRFTHDKLYEVAYYSESMMACGASCMSSVPDSLEKAH